MTSIKIDEEYPQQGLVRPLRPFDLAHRSRVRGQKASALPGPVTSPSLEAHLPASFRPSNTGSNGASDSSLSSIVNISSSPPLIARFDIADELTRQGYPEDQIQAAIQANFRAGVPLSINRCANWINILNTTNAGASDSPLTSIIEVQRFAAAKRKNPYRRRAHRARLSGRPCHGCDTSNILH